MVGTIMSHQELLINTTLPTEASAEAGSNHENAPGVWVMFTKQENVFTVTMLVPKLTQKEACAEWGLPLRPFDNLTAQGERSRNSYFLTL